MPDESNLSQVLSPEHINLNAPISSKKKLLEEMAGLLASDTSLGLRQKDIFHLLLEREKVGNTGIGEGIALPHSRCANIPKAVLAVISVQEAVDYDSIDKRPVKLAFGLLVPENANEQHLALLSKIARIMRISGRLDEISAIHDPSKLISSIARWETSS